MKKTIWILVVATMLSVPALGQEYLQMEEFSGEDTSSSGGWSGVSTYNNGQYVDNPCTATYDPVWVSLDVWVEGTQLLAGYDRYVFDESTTASGSYSAYGASQSDLTYPQAVTMRQYKKMNTYDQFHLVTVVNFDPYTRGISTSIETACGDGTPGSLQ